MNEEQVRAIVRDELVNLASESRQAFWDHLYASFEAADVPRLRVVGDGAAVDAINTP